MGDKAKESLVKLLVYSINTSIQGIISGIIITILMSIFFEIPLLSITSFLLIILITLSTIISGAMNFFSYAKPFHEIQTFVKKVSQGDLSYSPNEKNLGRLKSIRGPLENMRMGLQELLKEVQETSKTVHYYSQNLEKRVVETNENLQTISNELGTIKVSIDDQLISTKNVSTTMEEMSKGIGITAQTSNLANESSKEAFQLASTGKDKVQTTSLQMNSIHSSFVDLTIVIKELISRTELISEIVANINQIADQTNLLSLNANIEAARAGEHGKGFSVVAQEVGKLANQTNQSTSTIISIIEEVQQKAAQALHAMSKTSGDVNSGLSSVTELMQSFNNILASVSQVNNQMNDISSVGQQMAAGSEIVTESVGNLSNQFTGVNKKVIEFAEELENQAIAMNTVKDATIELNDVSTKLEELLKKFQIGTVN